MTYLILMLVFVGEEQCLIHGFKIYQMFLSGLSSSDCEGYILYLTPFLLHLTMGMLDSAMCDAPLLIRTE